MTAALPEQFARHGNYDGRVLTEDELFLTDYVQEAGLQAWTLREVAGPQQDQHIHRYRAA